MAIGERNRPAVPLEAGIGPENPPCPACGEPLFGWAMVRPAGLPVRRCERCGLAVKGARAEREEADGAAAAALSDGEAPNRASLQAWIGGSGWSALEPGRRFFFTVESLRLLGRSGARRGPAIAAMWQTLLNSFTFGHNVALGRLGRATATAAEKPWQRRLDLAISLLATPLALPVALLAELIAAAAGRGGRLKIGRGDERDI
jgi:hypothetical protein